MIEVGTRAVDSAAGGFQSSVYQKMDVLKAEIEELKNKLEKKE